MRRRSTNISLREPAVKSHELPVRFAIAFQLRYEIHLAAVSSLSTMRSDSSRKRSRSASSVRELDVWKRSDDSRDSIEQFSTFINSRRSDWSNSLFARTGSLLSRTKCDENSPFIRTQVAWDLKKQQLVLFVLNATR